jgi:Trypsin-like peptidase domain
MSLQPPQSSPILNFPPNRPDFPDTGGQSPPAPPISDLASVSMNNQAQRLIDFTVQIRHTTTNAVIGTGVIASEEGEIITCRHVVEMAGVDPTRATGLEVGIVLPRTRNRDERIGRARVTKCFLDYDDDVVVLQLAQGMTIAPSEIAVLGTADLSGGNPFRSYGFRKLDKSPSGYAEGTIMGSVLPFEGQKLQVDPIELRTRDVRPGMSGAGVLDMKHNLVVGLVTQRWNPGDSSVDDNIAWAIDNYVFKFEPVHLDFLDRD